MSDECDSREYWRGQVWEAIRSLREADRAAYRRIDTVEDQVDQLRRASARYAGAIIVAATVLSTVISAIIAYLSRWAL